MLKGLRLFSLFVGLCSFNIVAGPILLLDVIEHQNQLYAAAERGYIAKLDWQQSDKPVLIKTPTDVMLTAITSSEDNVLWAVGHEGVIVKSKDGGVSWEVNYQHGNGGALFDINFFDEQHGIAIGAYGLFLRTDDGGENWQQEFHSGLLPVEDIEYLNEIREQSEEDYLFELSSILPHLNQVKLIDSTLYVVGELGLFAASTDLGKSWQRLNISYQGSLYDVAQAKQGIWISGMRGNLYFIGQQSITNALSDSETMLDDNKIDFPEPVNLNKITCKQELCIVLGNSQTVWKIDDNEVLVVDKFKSKSFVSAIILDERTAYLVGENSYNKLRLAN